MKIFRSKYSRRNNVFCSTGRGLSNEYVLFQPGREIEWVNGKMMSFISNYKTFTSNESINSIKDLDRNIAFPKKTMGDSNSWYLIAYNGLLYDAQLFYDIASQYGNNTACTMIAKGEYEDYAIGKFIDEDTTKFGDIDYDAIYDEDPYYDDDLPALKYDLYRLFR